MENPIPIKEPAWLKEFKAFIMRGNVIDLAVGIVIGAAFTAIVTSVVEDLINPIVGLILGGIDFSNLFVVLAGERKPSLDATRDGGAAVIAIGSFVNAVIKFVIVGFAVVWMVKAINKLQR
jgi:large conductance mechanosensitive channel